MSGPQHNGCEKCGWAKRPALMALMHNCHHVSAPMPLTLPALTPPVRRIPALHMSACPPPTLLRGLGGTHITSATRIARRPGDAVCMRSSTRTHAWCQLPSATHLLGSHRPDNNHTTTNHTLMPVLLPGAANHNHAFRLQGESNAAPSHRVSVRYTSYCSCKPCCRRRSSPSLCVPG